MLNTNLASVLRFELVLTTFLMNWRLSWGRERCADDRNVGVLYVYYGIFDSANCESVIAFTTGFNITSLQHVKWMSYVGVRFVEYIITPGTGFTKLPVCVQISPAVLLDVKNFSCGASKR